MNKYNIYIYALRYRPPNLFPAFVYTVEKVQNGGRNRRIWVIPRRPMKALLSESEYAIETIHFPTCKNDVEALGITQNDQVAPQ